MAILLLLALVTMMLGLATAGPVLPSKPTPARTGCRIGIFQSLEERLLRKDVQCSLSPCPSSRKLEVQGRPKALQADLALTLEVLENVTDSALGPILHQPLHTLRHIQSQLQACVNTAQPTAEPGSQSHRLSRWLHRLQEAQEKETPGCLEASVTSNLMRLLIRDLMYVAAGDQCVWGAVAWHSASKALDSTLGTGSGKVRERAGGGAEEWSRRGRRPTSNHGLEWARP
ncbi:interferon lambda-2-like [Alexandromys fortis]|uniref:interferon lambda-2-like n=1 Tax=Alexandromys fortis TaxID=100897 RepID=UPI00215212FF|nr:interferon lambda-2-like [Microtus fortis]